MRRVLYCPHFTDEDTEAQRLTILHVRYDISNCKIWIENKFLKTAILLGRRPK